MRARRQRLAGAIPQVLSSLKRAVAVEIDPRIQFCVAKNNNRN